MATPVPATGVAYEYPNMTNRLKVLLNTTEPTCSHNVHDMDFNKNVRIIILFLTVGLNILGSTLVLVWIIRKYLNTRKFRRLSRVNSFMLNLTVADILVILLAILPQLLWEYADRKWTVGPVMCRLVKLLQSFSITSSNYMLVVIALDRHQAIRSPLKESIPVWKMAAAGWVMAVLVNSPIVGLFHTNEIDGQMKCENVFRGKPKWHRQLWLTYIICIVFIIPLVIIAIGYIRIALKISQKAKENSDNGKRAVSASGKVLLHSTPSNSLPSAKRKTLKMTIVIVLAFILCSFPYCIVEIIMSYGDHCMISPELAALLGGMAAFNSATNPFIFLIFNAKIDKSSRGSDAFGLSISQALSPQHSIRSRRTFKRQLTRESQF